jgi:hypothetical protein
LSDLNAIRLRIARQGQGERGLEFADLLKLREIYMADVIFPKRAPTPRELDTRPIPDDYRPKNARVDASSYEDSENDQADEFHEQGYSESSTEVASQVNLHKLEHELNRNPLNEIAIMMRALTYGEMMELAQAIWKIRPEGEGVNQDSLPMLLHRWSTSFEH